MDQDDILAEEYFKKRDADQRVADLLDREEAVEAERWLRQREFKGVRTLSNLFARSLTKTFGWLTPNIITILGAALCAPAIWFYEIAFQTLSVMTIALSFTTDWLDGALARYQERKFHMPSVPIKIENKWSLWKRINTRGKTNLGKNIDPFVDKVRYFWVLFKIGYGYISPTMIWISFATAIALTAIRPIMSKMNLGAGESNRLGKYKALIELAAIATIFLIPHNKTGATISNFLVGSAMFAGFGSFSGHLFLVLRKSKRLRLRRLKQ